MTPSELKERLRQIDAEMDGIRTNILELEGCLERLAVEEHKLYMSCTHEAPWRTVEIVDDKYILCSICGESQP